MDFLLQNFHHYKISAWHYQNKQNHTHENMHTNQENSHDVACKN
jgi:hypothetical protein